MGGNALNFDTRRVEHHEYDVLWDRIWHKLMESGITDKARRTRHYYNKSSFGDMDIVCRGPWPKDVEKRVKETFDNKDYHSNTWCKSFDVDDFQIDLMYFSPENYEVAYFYFSFNDLNNFVGKTAHKFGLKFGHDGLSVPLRNKHGGVVRKIYLSRDPRRIYEFLGYDYDEWVDGFYSLDDIFNFAISSEFFSVDMYKDENLTHRTRVRDKKRKTFQRFRAWLDENNITRIHEFKKDKSGYENFIHDAFPEINYKAQLREFEKLEARKEKAKKKFNGHIIMDLTPLKGKPLGKFIGFIKDSFKDEPTFRGWVLNTPQQHINKYIKDRYCEFQQQ